MIAALIDRYGSPDVFRIAETRDPALGPTQVLVRVRASSVNPIDWKIRNGSLFFLTGLRFPKILGFDLAGEVVSSGANSSRFKPGDFVYARSDRKTGGAYAQLVAVGERALAPKPGNLSFREAAAIPLAGLTALQALRDKGGLRTGQKALVLGASGGVGVFAVQIAKALGAEVAAVCGTSNVDLVKSLGADRVIDYKTADVRRVADRFDVIFDAVGSYGALAMAPLLEKRGRYVSTLPGPGLIVAALTGLVSGKSARFIHVEPLGADLEFLTSLAERGSFRPVIDSEFPLTEVAAAHRRSESKHARGKIVVNVA